MKKIITVILFAVSAFYQNETNAQCSNTPSYTETYNNGAGWTDVNRTTHANYFGVASGVYNYSNTSGTIYCGREQRSYKSIPALDNKFWVAECKFVLTGGNAGSALIMSMTSGNQDTWYSQTGQNIECTVPFAGTNTNQDAIFALLNSPAPSTTSSSPVTTGTWYICAGYKDDLTVNNSASGGIPINANGTYYIRLTRTDYSSGLISVFSNAAMTNHVASSPKCFDITPGTSIANLTYLQHGIATMGSCYRSLNAQIDDFKYYNGQSPCPLPLSPIITANTVYCSGSPVNVSGSLSTSGSTIPIKDHVWITTECNSSGVNIAGTEVWGPFISGAPIGDYTIPAATINCDKYYNVVLALQNCGNIWASTSKMIHVVCSPQVNVTGPQVVCASSGAVLTATGTGVNTYSWAPTGQTGNSIIVHPSIDCEPTCGRGDGKTYYTVTATNSYGCTSTASIGVLPLSQTYTIDISTGVNTTINPSTLISVGSGDSDWKIRGLANTTPYSSSFSNLTNATVINTYAGWINSANERWITSKPIGADADVHAPASTSSGQSAYYWYENRFTFPYPYTDNYKLNITEIASDNMSQVYLNSPDALTTGNTTSDVFIYAGGGVPTFNSFYGPFTVTGPSRFKTGENVIQVGVLNESQSITPTGFIMRGSVTGSCAITEPCGGCRSQYTELVSNHGTSKAKEKANLYPNPFNNNFTTIYTGEGEVKVEVTDVLGKILVVKQGVAQQEINLEMTDAPPGIYLVKITAEDDTIMKKIIKQ